MISWYQNFCNGIQNDVAVSLNFGILQNPTYYTQALRHKETLRSINIISITAVTLVVY